MILDTELTPYAAADVWARGITNRGIIDAMKLDRIAAGQMLMREAVSLMTNYNDHDSRAMAFGLCEVMIAKQRADKLQQDNTTATEESAT